MSTLGPVNERMIDRVVKDITQDVIHQRIKNNALSLGVTANAEVIDVAETLIRHYQQDSAGDHCQDIHRNMRFLENVYENKGGGKYLLELFPQGKGVIHTIHALLELPDLNMDIDTGFGTAF